MSLDTSVNITNCVTATTSGALDELFRFSYRVYYEPLQKQPRVNKPYYKQFDKPLRGKRKL